MAQERPSRLVEWYLALKAWAPRVPEHASRWLEAVRAEPTLIWQTTAIRYATYGLVGLILVSVISAIPEWVVGPPPADARAASDQADFHVICTNPTCGHHFVLHRDKDFHRFPVECPKCRQTTGEHARQCWSDTCRGRWVAPVEVEGSLLCPVCGQRIGSP